MQTPRDYGSTIFNTDSGHETFGRKGTSDGSSRVLRGASWDYNNPDNLRVENRNTNDPSNRNNNIGFRVLLAAGG